MNKSRIHNLGDRVTLFEVTDRKDVYVQLSEFGGKKIGVKIKCPCGRGDSGEHLVRCPEQLTKFDEERPEIWGECSACEKKVTTKLFMYRVHMLEPLTLGDEKVEEERLIIQSAIQKWNNRSALREILDLIFRRKLRIPGMIWNSKNNFNKTNMPETAFFAIRCPDCEFGIGHSEKLRLEDLHSGPIYQVAGNCILDGKPLKSLVNLR